LNGNIQPILDRLIVEDQIAKLSAL
jgi:hypothetical protein